MATHTLNDQLRALPSVEEVLESRECTALANILPRSFVADAARQVIADARQRTICSKGATPVPADLPQQAAKHALALLSPSLKHVINATGVVVHTNLGRSVLADDAIQAVVQAARGYSTLEYDVEAMRRGSRHAHCEQLICALTGAEAAMAVNNNAAAVLMVLSEFARDREAVVSRGELVEIGGSFRIPDIMELSGARMVEVGTTNKTHPYDYVRAITDDTAMLLKVHTSNYRLVGFTEAVDAHELRRIADEAECSRNADTEGATRNRILVYEDLGSGALLPLSGLGDNSEPTAREALHGCDLVSFSGDKLLGGPQAGIIIGSKELIGRLKANPLARAMRLDKMTIAALEATLRLYLEPERALEEVPTLRMLNEPESALKTKAAALREKLMAAVSAELATFETIPEISRAGGGALPMLDIPTFAVKTIFHHGNAQDCEEYLVRENPTPIVARIKQEAVLFDVRTLIDDGEMSAIVEAMTSYFERFAVKPKGGAR